MEILTQRIVSTGAFDELMMYILFLNVFIIGGCGLLIYMLLRDLIKKFDTSLRIIIKCIYIAFWLAISIIAFTHGINYYNTMQKEVMQYDVVMDDSVSFNEIAEKYDVIKIDGKLITIQDKIKK